MRKDTTAAGSGGTAPHKLTGSLSMRQGRDKTMAGTLLDQPCTRNSWKPRAYVALLESTIYHSYNLLVYTRSIGRSVRHLATALNVKTRCVGGLFAHPLTKVTFIQIPGTGICLNSTAVVIMFCCCMVVQKPIAVSLHLLGFYVPKRPFMVYSTTMPCAWLAS